MLHFPLSAIWHVPWRMQYCHQGTGVIKQLLHCFISSVISSAISSVVSPFILTLSYIKCIGINYTHTYTSTCTCICHCVMVLHWCLPEDEHGICKTIFIIIDGWFIHIKRWRDFIAPVSMMGQNIVCICVIFGLHARV